MKDREERRNQREKGSIGLIGTLLICILLLLTAGGLTAYIYLVEPEAQRVGATKKTGMLVETTGARRGSYRPIVTGLGRVTAANEIVLMPRVSGRVLEIADSFLPGGFVSQREALVKIDPADYLNAVEQRRSALVQSRAQLDLEMGRQDVAEREYRLLDRRLNANHQALALRKPQLQSARSAVDSAHAALDQARLDLERTTIKAPFDAQILTRDVSPGSLVSPQTALCRLVGTGEYWVVVTLPIGKLKHVSFAEQGRNGSSVRLRNRSAWPADVYRQGELSRLIGELDERTRLARVLVIVKDPLSREDDADGPPLIVGSILEARIQGEEIQDVFRINRDYVRDNDTVWVMRDAKLAIEEVEIVFWDREYAYITDGLEEGGRIVMTNLTTIAEGAALRATGDGSTGPADEGADATPEEAE